MTEQQIRPNFRHYDPRDCVACREGRHLQCEHLIALENVEPAPFDGEDICSSPDVPGTWCGCFYRDEDSHYESFDPGTESSEEPVAEKYGDIELSVAWEVVFTPFKSTLERVPFDRMLSEIQDMLSDPAAPTWRDDIQLVGNFDKYISLGIDDEARTGTLAPASVDAFQDWVMRTLAEMGYEGWSVANRIVTIQKTRTDVEVELDEDES